MAHGDVILKCPHTTNIKASYGRGGEDRRCEEQSGEKRRGTEGRG